MRYNIPNKIFAKPPLHSKGVGVYVFGEIVENEIPYIRENIHDDLISALKNIRKEAEKYVGCDCDKDDCRMSKIVSMVTNALNDDLKDF